MPDKSNGKFEARNEPARDTTPDYTWRRRSGSDRYDGPMAPVVVSILAVLAWAVFILLWALIWSVNYSLFQNIVVAIVSLIITGLLVGLMWILLTPRRAWHWR